MPLVEKLRHMAVFPVWRSPAITGIQLPRVPWHEIKLANVADFPSHPCEEMTGNAFAAAIRANDSRRSLTNSSRSAGPQINVLCWSPVLIATLVPGVVK